ncbi:alpha/beta fold hydrolase [Gynuella sunshinyii]|uniref:Lysophospholipase n=1 Tax=Gynuella sunshinyii YC6258 TaxID=1445510 RepID=A0A0C5W2A5_9GAMM|nr:alpha/beta fold hydrolase [Gynuella sunshinyii]AJQ96794.1 lysophospholipase [Gynuella sunshinyii YC6258]
MGFDLTVTARKAVVGSLSAAMPNYFGNLGARLFLHPRANKSKRHWANAFEGFEHHSIFVDGHKVPVWTRGEGQPVMLVHGWERDHFTMGGFVAPLLQSGYQVAALDLPAHGEAEGGTAPLPLLAKAIAAATDSLNHPAIVIAHSIGAAMTVLAMEDYQLKPLAAVLISAPSSAKAYAVSQATDIGLSRSAIGKMVTGISTALGAPLERFRVDLALKKLPTRTILIHAKDDNIVPFSEAETNAAAAAVQTLWQARGGHNKILGDAEMINQVLAWLHTHQATIQAETQKTSI